MSKNFEEFLSTIDENKLILDLPKYVSKRNFSDESEKYLYSSLALSKSLLNQYHQWLNS